MDETINILMKSDFFKYKSHCEIQDIIHRTDYRINRFERGSLIVQMGEVFPFMGIVLSGSVEVHRPLMTGHTVCIKYISVNAMFGGAVAYWDKETRYPCDIIGRNPGELKVLEDRKLIHVNDKKISLTGRNGLEAVLY